MSVSEKNVLSVKALNEFVKRIVENNSFLNSINIRGEISNFTNHYRSGHLYFSLKDEDAQVRCIMYASAAATLKRKPYDGAKVTAHGRISLFVRDGQYIFYVDRLEFDGVGELYLKYEELKNKLQKEGLFDPSKKRPIPKYPRAIGVITTQSGAAFQDIRNIITRRYPAVEIVLYPSLVQGAGAEDSLCAGIEFFSASSCPVDTIIIGRGGGSIEDLWCFNSERLAYVIAACPIPVISAVGHETDFTICDFAADLRAPTPSAAAELAVPDSKELIRRLGNVIKRMQLLVEYKISAYRASVKRCAESKMLLSPMAFVDEKKLSVDRLDEMMYLYMDRIIDKKREYLERCDIQMNLCIKQNINLLNREYMMLTAKLEALNPMAVISRGYSAVFDGDDKLIKSIDDIEIGTDINIRLTDGTVTAKAVSKKGNENG